MPLISMRNVYKSFPASRKGEPPLTALDNVSLDIEAGEIYGIIGYSGAGKSTLVRLINGLEKTTSGDVVVDGQQVSGAPDRKLQKLRLDIGMVFQQFNLFSAKTVRNNVAYPLRVAGRSRAEIDARVGELLAFVGLEDKAGSYPEQLSGGQKQRVGIARALATSPKILLADEATSALDPETTHEVLALLRRVNRELGITIVVITHEMDVIRNLATRVAVMDGGRIVEEGEVFEVFSNPQQASSRRFVSTVVRNVPTPDELDILRTRHEGRLVTFSFRDGDTSQASVFLELADAGVAFELVYGGVNDIAGRAFGHLTLALKGADAAIDPVLASIGSRINVTELSRA